MIKARSAFTEEVDDVEEAIAAIREQLGGFDWLLANTIGLLTCYSDFIGSEASRGICEALPFDVVGGTTLGNAVHGSSGNILLTLLVLSSDDVEFSAGISAPLHGADEAVLKDAWDEAAVKLNGKPAMMATFAPLLVPVSGDFYANSFSNISGNLPNFGMLVVDNNNDYHETRVIFNGESYADRCAIVIMAGNLDVKFMLASISPERIFMDKGVVTSSNGNQVQTVNERPVVEYLESLGLKRNDDGSITGVNAFPFVVDYNDGTTPVVRVIFGITEEGYAICGGDIPNGSTLSVGHIDSDEVLSTTSELISDALESGEPDCILMFSCVGRYFALGYTPMSEMERVQKLMEDTRIPYQLTYSGGELCPVYTSGGECIKNRNHNDTFIMCLLYNGA
jgi:hypothetical protein